MFDLGANGVTARAENKISISSGWQGVDFGADALAYKIYDKDGNLLTDGWVIFESKCRIVDPKNDVLTTVAAAGIDIGHARRYDNLSIDLTEYFALCDNLAVEYAFVVNGVPEESRDRFVPFQRIVNITQMN